MRGLRWLVPCAVSVAMASGCGGMEDADSDLASILAQREARLEQALTLPDSVETDAPVLRWILPERLREISGLVLTGDGRLFVHGDEVATIHEIDYRRGVIMKEFSLGSPAVRGDFEAITMVRDTLVLLTSDGMLYWFTEGVDSGTVAYTRIDTGLGTQCEFEGMAHDSVANTLVLACKNVRTDGLDNALVLYHWSPEPGAMAPGQSRPPVVVPLTAIIGTRDWNDFQPSDLTINRLNGNYLIVAARQQGLVEITPAGEVVASRSLPPGHAQAEGIALTSDSVFLVSDEAATGRATLTGYRWQP